jgi:hypothetical protein
LHERDPRRCHRELGEVCQIRTRGRRIRLSICRLRSKAGEGHASQEAGNYRDDLAPSNISKMSSPHTVSSPCAAFAGPGCARAPSGQTTTAPNERRNEIPPPHRAPQSAIGTRLYGSEHNTSGRCATPRAGPTSGAEKFRSSVKKLFQQ